MDRLDRDALAEFGVEAPGDRIRPPVSRRRRHRPFTSGAKQGFKDALAEGVMLGHRHLGPEHVLLAITRRTRNDPAMQLLAAAGVSSDSLRTTLIERNRRSA